jgi:capsular polysaccharide biosynthesis protein
MKLLIATDTNNISTDIDKSNLSSFTEYGMNFSNIKLDKICNKIKNSGKFYSTLLLIPMTHINNLWHLMHHMYITYKYLKNNNIVCDTMCPIFFKGFYERQGIITECIYNELIFKGLGFDYNKFKNIYEIFKQNKYISINNIYHVNESINFLNETLFDDFKQTILTNFCIEYEKKNTQNITFILRKGTREITNINYVINQLQSYNIRYIYLENYTIKKQLEIIANTDILIGVHGAGLTWCVFMKDDSTLIELYPENSNTDNYIRWCKIANIKYKRLCINITAGNVNNFRDTTVNININQLQSIQSIILTDNNFLKTFNIKHCWKNHPVNIGHFFHDVLFQGCVSYIKDKSIKWVLDNDLSDWEYKLTMCIINYLHINYQINNTEIDTTFMKYDRNIKNNYHFDSVMQIIRNSVFNRYKFQEKNKDNTTHKVIYFRDDASRRKMIHYNNDLNLYFDEIVIDMASKTFEEQVKLFNKTTHFVTIEGAHLTNIIFMNPDAKILVFSPTRNSWQEMFGTYIFVNHFEIVTTGGNFNSNIKFNDQIKNKIIEFIS